MKKIVYLITFCLMIGDLYPARLILADFCKEKWPLSSSESLDLRWLSEPAMPTFSSSILTISPFTSNPPNQNVPGIVGQDPAVAKSKSIDLGGGISLEVVYIEPGRFMMGSTKEEKIWATGWEGGAQPGPGLPGTGTRESYEGVEPFLVNIKEGFWMGRTEITVGQFKRFIEETGYITDAEKAGGGCQVFDPEWEISGVAPPHPWIHLEGKSWRDPNFGFPLRNEYPVVCVSYNDDKAFCKWLTEKERAAGRLPEGMVYRLPTEAEWEYACRGGQDGSKYFWWGNDLSEGEGRLNISGIDFLPGRNKTWVYGKVPWSDGFAFVSPVDYYGDRGRNGFGLADMLGNVWEFVLDDFDPKGGHGELYIGDDGVVTHNVCKGGNYFDVPGNARSAVRLGINSTSYSDSRDGFRICLGVVKN